MSAGRVVVAGSVNQDVVVTVNALPDPGETVSGAQLTRGPGGKGANQAVAARRAGADVVMHAAVGADDAGTDLLSFLHGEGVDVSAVVHRQGVPTGTAIVTVDACGENTIVVIAAANATLGPTDVANVFATADVLVAQLETPIATTQAFFAAGRAASARCVFNPAPAADVPDEVLALVDVLIVNEAELATLTGHRDPAVGARTLTDRRFAGALIVTLGARGAVAVRDGTITTVPPRVVEAVDATGAGDCFVGYLAAGLAAGRDLDVALSVATAAAALCVQRPGASAAMPHAAELG